MAILTEQQVLSIKSALYKGVMLLELARKYGVSDRAISHIKCGRAWPQVKWPNGSKGAIPKGKRLQITRSRMKQRAADAKALTRGKGHLK
jgi:hypothetical protein